jgi:hypothetical protein
MRNETSEEDAGRRRKTTEDAGLVWPDQSDVRETANGRRMCDNQGGSTAKQSVMVTCKPIKGTS